MNATQEKVWMDAEHRYSIGPVPGVTLVPGVNEILNLYYPPSNFYTERGRVLGKVRHQWFDFLSQGKEPSESPDPEIAQEIDNFKEWLSAVKPLRAGGETMFFDPLLRLAGTPDWYGIIYGRLAVVDFKPETKSKRTLAQTAAYCHLLRANNIPVLDRYELRLGEKKYRFEQHKDAGDITRWKALVFGFHAATYFK